MRRSGRGVVAAACVFVVLGLPAMPAWAAVSCSFDPIKGVMIVSAPADGDQVTLLRGPDDKIIWNGTTCVGGGATATLSNAGVVRVDGGAGSQEAEIDLTGGDFGGVAFDVDLGAGTDLVQIGPASSDSVAVAVGETLFSILSIASTHAGVEQFVLIGGAGPDSLSLGGLGALDARYAGTGTIVGGAGHDTLMGGRGPDSFAGGPGRDLLSYAGRPEDLSLSADGIANDGAVGEGDNIENALAAGSGGHGIDAVLGGDGNDVFQSSGWAAAAAPFDAVYCAPSNVGATRPDLCGGRGLDTFIRPFAAIAGGPDTDTADWSSQTGQVVTCDLPNRTAQLEDDVEVQIAGSADFDYLCGGDGPNVLIGGDGADHLDGGLGPDELIGGEGVDTVMYASHAVGVTASLDGQENDGIAGEDLIRDDVENLRGGSGPDHLTGNDTANQIIGGLADDILEGGGAPDVLQGENGEDEIHGGDGPDQLFGGPLNDELFGDGDRDTLVGGGANDALHGGDSHDLLDGGLGADQIAGDAGNRDKVTYGDRTARVVVTLRGGANDGQAGEGDRVFDTVEWVLGGSGNDEFVSASRGPAAGIAADHVFIGNGGDDTLKGGGGRDVLEGGDGDDTLLGGDGADTLDGEGDRDRLEGEGGPDELVGGSGDDFFLRGQGGSDRLFAEDGFGENVNCGPGGADEAHVDSLDDVANNCETVL